MMLFVCIETGRITAWFKLLYFAVGLNYANSFNWLFFERRAWFLNKPSDVPLLGKLRLAKAVCIV
jgi:hypothetical protein